MKKLFTILLMMPLLWACSSSDDDVNFTMSESKITVVIGEEQFLTLEGVSVYDCDISILDDFIADASDNDNKIYIRPLHVGETILSVRYKGVEKRCAITVTSSNDYIGDVFTEWGTTLGDLKEKLKDKYDRGSYNDQRDCMSYFKTESGYKIEDRYYFDEIGLSGVMKVVSSTDTDIQVLLNLSKSMADYCDHLSFNTETINSYPKAKVSINTYSYPDKYYACYKQTRYEILYETGKSPKTTNYIYYAKDLETAKKPTFSYLNK